MEIAIVKIEERNIKAIKRYLRKWRVRRNDGATLLSIAVDCKMSGKVAKETLEWMFRHGEVCKVNKFECLEIRYVA